MQIQQSLVVEKLHHLRAILNDSSEGYLTAATYAHNKDLENFFERLSYQRKDFAREIKKLIKSMGAHTPSVDGFLSLLHRTWKDMTYQLKSRDKDAVKTCCLIGEKFTSNYYESILNDEDIPDPIKNVLHLQLQSIHSCLHQLELAQSENVVATSNTAMATQTVSLVAEKKIVYLISYLQQVARDFEMIADDLEDRNLKHAFLTLSGENQQFARDLQCQAKHFGLGLSQNEFALFMENEFPETFADSRKNELLHICDKSEYLFLKLYTDALKEFIGFARLKELMIFQYNNIRAGFVKIRMLNSVRLDHQYSM